MCHGLCNWPWVVDCTSRFDHRTWDFFFCEIHGEIHCLILKFIRRLLGFIDSRCLAGSCFSISGNFIYFKDGIFPLWEDVFVWKTCGQCPTPGLLVLGLTIYTFRPLATGSKCRNFHKTKSVETRRKVITLR